MTIQVTNQAPRAGSTYGYTVNGNATSPNSAAPPVTASAGWWDGMQGSDADGDPLTYHLVTAAGADATADEGGWVATAHGRVRLEDGQGVLDPAGDSYDYQPNPGFVGDDRFYYVVTDGADGATGRSNVASVTITVTGQQPQPALASYGFIPQVPGQSLDLIPGGATGDYYNRIMQMASWPVDPSQFRLVTRPAHGTLWTDDGTQPLTPANPDDPNSRPSDYPPAGSLIYTPAADFAGEDSFTYDFGPLTQPTPATIDVGTYAGYWNNGWGLGGGQYTVSHGGTLTKNAGDGDLLGANSVDPSSNPVFAEGATQPAHGTVAVRLDGSFTYTPAPDFTGWDSFSYQAYDPYAGPGEPQVSPPVYASVDVTDSLPQTPRANADMWTYQGQAQRLDLRQPYVDGQHPLASLKAAVVPGMGPSHGTLTDNGDDTLTYLPADGYSGPDSFTYTVSDGVTTTLRGTDSADPVTTGNYQTCFFDVRPLPVSLSVDGLQPGDPSATVPLDPAALAPSALHLNIPSGLPWGTRVTLTIKSETPADAAGGAGSLSQPQTPELVQVYDPSQPAVVDPGNPPPSLPPGKLILGGAGGAGGTTVGRTYTWTVGDGTVPPAQVLVSGNASGQVAFELDVTPGDNNGGPDGGIGIFGPLCAAIPLTGPSGPSSQPAAPAAATNPSTRPVPATQPVTVPSGPKPLVIGFYGADVPVKSAFSLNVGNQEMEKIGKQVGAVMFHWNEEASAFRQLINTLDTNGDGRYDPDHPYRDRAGHVHPPDVRRSIRIFGHSWGALTAIQLAQWMADSREFKNQKIDVLVTVDAVNYKRNDHGGVPGNVNLYWNRYETKTAGGGVVIPGINYHPHGYNPASQAQHNDVAPDLNPDGTATETDMFIYPNDGYRAGEKLLIDHFNIIGVVESDLIKVVTQ